MNNETNKAVSAEGSGVRRYVVTHAYWDPMHAQHEWSYVLASDHDAAVAALTARVAQLEEALARTLNGMSRVSIARKAAKYADALIAELAKETK